MCPDGRSPPNQQNRRHRKTRFPFQAARQNHSQESYRDHKQSPVVVRRCLMGLQSEQGLRVLKAHRREQVARTQDLRGLGSGLVLATMSERTAGLVLVACWEWAP